MCASSDPSLLFFAFGTLPDLPLCCDSMSFKKFILFSSSLGGLRKGEFPPDYCTGGSNCSPSIPSIVLAFSIDLLFLVWTDI